MCRAVEKIAEKRYREGLAQGEEDGVKKGQAEIVRTLSEKMSPDEIARMLGYTLEQVKALLEQ